MSDENVKLVQSLYAAFGRGEIDTIAKAMTPDYRWRVAGDKKHFPTIGEWSGPGGVADFFAKVGQHLNVSEFSPREFYPSKDRVFVLGHYKWTVRKTGKPAAADFVHIFTIKDGKVSGFQEFTDTATFAEAYRG
jgi:uncharacterized protein